MSLHEFREILLNMVFQINMNVQNVLIYIWKNVFRQNHARFFKTEKWIRLDYQQSAHCRPFTLMFSKKRFDMLSQCLAPYIAKKKKVNSYLLVLGQQPCTVLPIQHFHLSILMYLRINKRIFNLKLFLR